MLESGNATMAIWLGKQYLGQRDQFQYDVGSVQIQIVCPAISEQPSVPVGDAGVTIDIGPTGYDFSRELPATTKSQERLLGTEAD
jgi:hypothetical protein